MQERLSKAVFVRGCAFLWLSHMGSYGHRKENICLTNKTLNYPALKEYF